MELMECFNVVRPLLWRGRGRDLLAPVAYIDVDGTLTPTLGKKKAGIDMYFKGVWATHRLVISLANTGEVLYLVNRPGDAVSHQEAAPWIDRAMGLVAPHAGRVCVRGDTDFSLTANFDRWSDEVARPPGHRTGKTRYKRADVKAGIVRERGYVNRRLKFEDVAESTTGPPSAARPTGWWSCARTSAR